MSRLPIKKAKELTLAEIKMIPTVSVRFRYRDSKDLFDCFFTLHGNADKRNFYFFATIDEVLRVFPDKAEMTLKQSGELATSMPLRITFGKTDKKNNDFGYYSRYELLILNENRNVIADGMPASVRNFVIENYKSMRDYIILQNITIDDLLNALRESRGN